MTKVGERLINAAKDAKSLTKLLYPLHAQIQKLTAERDRYREALEGADKTIPTNWLDPLLTGDRRVLKSGKHDCREVEALLRGVQNRLRDHVRAALNNGEEDHQ